MVLFYNESETLPRCLDSLKWCDRVYAIDGKFVGYGDEHEAKKKQMVFQMMTHVRFANLMTM